MKGPGINYTKQLQHNNIINYFFYLNANASVDSNKKKFNEKKKCILF